jgi:hypothetical protein
MSNSSLAYPEMVSAEVMPFQLVQCRQLQSKSAHVEVQLTSQNELFNRNAKWSKEVREKDPDVSLGVWVRCYLPFCLDAFSRA